MKKIYILLLFIIPLLLIGCTAEPLEPGNVEAADSVATERPAEEDVQTSEQSEKLPGFPLKYCPVSHPPQESFIPPAPYKENPYPGQFWYGTKDLWTAVPINHTWHSLPYDPERGYTQKVVFWREGYFWLDEPEPALTVSGRLITLDNSEPLTFIASRATNGYTPEDQSFMLTGVEIPAAGCWEITGQYGEDSLTFVVWVSPE